MEKILKNTIIVSMSALLSASAFADNTYSYNLEDKLLTVVVDDVTYSYLFTATPTVATSDQTVSLGNPTYENYIFNNVTSSNTPDSALYAYNGDSISGVFIGNDSTAGATSNLNAGAIYVNEKYTLSTGIDGLFVGNTSVRSGGAITNAGTIESITGTFVNNAAKGTNGGAIANLDTATIAYINADFIGNTANTNGGAIYNAGTISSLSGTFLNNEATTEGGAIFNTQAGKITIVSSEGSDTTFTGNTSASGAYAIMNNGTLTFTAGENSSIILNDGINSNAGTPTIAISGTGTTVFNNEVSGQIITVASGATLALGSYGSYSADLTDSTVSVNGTLSLVVSELSSIDLSTTTFNTSSSLALDLTDIYGSFDLTITSTTLDIDSLNVILGDGSVITLDITEDGDYTATSLSDSNYYTDFTLTSTSTGYTIIGTAAVPEPSTYAMIFGVVALGFAAYRRRK